MTARIQQKHGETYKAFKARAARKREKVMALLAQGMSQSEVARRVGVSRQRVHTICRNAT